MYHFPLKAAQCIGKYSIYIIHSLRAKQAKIGFQFGANMKLVPIYELIILCTCHCLNLIQKQMTDWNRLCWADPSNKRRLFSFSVKELFFLCSTKLWCHHSVLDLIWVAWESGLFNSEISNIAKNAFLLQVEDQNSYWKTSLSNNHRQQWA